jgi:hypothetical protein
MTRRRALAALFSILPALFFAGWLLYEQLPNWLSPVPAWLQPTNPGVVFGACEALASLRAYDGRFALGESAPVAPDSARDAASKAVRQLYADSASAEIAAQGPVLVRATFPAAGERLAWLNVATLERDPAERLGKVAILYTDAQTNDLLAAVTSVSVTDAQIACGGPPASRRVLVRQYLPLILLVADVGLVVFIWLVLRLVPRRQKPQ